MTRAPSRGLGRETDCAEPALATVVHEGRGGYVDVGGVRYAIEHIEAGRFVIHFPSGHRHAKRSADRRALEALVASEPTKWSLEDRTRGR